MDDPIGAFVPHGRYRIEGKNRKESGTLSGLTFAVKDIIDVEGHITGCGNPDCCGLIKKLSEQHLV